MSRHTKGGEVGPGRRQMGDYVDNERAHQGRGGGSWTLTNGWKPCAVQAYIETCLDLVVAERP